VSLDLTSIAILGTGSMGGAILNGLRSPDVRTAGIRVTTRSQASADALAAQGVDAVASEAVSTANVDAVRGADVVLLGVKPYAVPELLAEIAPALAPGQLVVSVAAGVTCATMQALVPEGVAVVRAMPNTPANVGLGVTGVAPGPAATDAQTALAAELFRAVGSVLVLDESQIDALSAISGSGPAFVFFFMEQLTRTAEQLGFAPDDARMLVEHTFRGASELLAVSDVDPAELRRRVTSPKGTTERGVAVLEQADLTGLFDRMAAAAIARAKELAAG
jgi:pyrroline-5-carboxylate reductase